MITISAKSKTGSVVEFQVEEIISIDGQPYVRQATETEVRNHLAGLTLKVAAIERLLVSQGLELESCDG